jgi:hypothetical protein
MQYLWNLLVGCQGRRKYSLEGPSRIGHGKTVINVIDVIEAKLSVENEVLSSNLLCKPMQVTKPFSIILGLCTLHRFC